MNRAIFLITFVISLTGCFPYIVMTEPKINLIVKDSDGRLVDQAHVVLTTILKDGKITQTYKSQYTENGMAYFDIRKSLTLNMGTNRQYFWSICISKEGYKLQTHTIKDQSNLEIHLEKLQDSEVNQKCPTHIRRVER
ncbi:hypothetical protein [Acinetobacter bereziniae]|uniref:Carboxypeptidase regulatory-like domain-containing protein n=1 Tax=Acinetobacter bereziniae NIPH 3 TaxID=1217651 RepID=N8X7D0_ACIBZ|nr:hypothetical protein [Acinetobacter bereziniae]ENV20332.1 hypothetical protein F963_03616 [Acinetobacter bereziniae NIPH 3]MCV2442762.1 hypothetical protein [Acinetobacter bereziniae]